MTKSSTSKHHSEKNQEKNQDRNRQDRDQEGAADRMQRQARDVSETAGREIQKNMDNFLTPFFSMQKQMNRAMEDMFSSMTGLWGAPPLDKIMPKVSVWEDEDAFHLKTRLPQDNPENMEIAVNDNILTLKWHDDRRQNSGPHQFYASHDAFRTIMIPENADPEKIEAVCKNGSLEVIVAKRETNRDQGRSIPIRNSA